MHRYLDGRILAWLAIPLYLLIATATTQEGRNRVLKLVEVDWAPMPFYDTRMIVWSAECAGKGIDPLVANPCAPLSRIINYPRIWLSLSAFSIGQDDVNRIGTVMGAAFLVSALLLLPPLSAAHGVVALLALFSPAAGLAIERANTDLIVFTLLAVMIFLLGSSSNAVRTCSYGLLQAATVLKLYPIFAAVAAIRERPRKALVILGILAAISGLYFLATFQDIQLALRNTPQSIYNSYSSQHLGFFIVRSLAIRGVEAPWLGPVVRIAASAGAILVSFLLARRIRGDATAARPIDTRALDGLRLSASLYCGTFLLGFNFSYRLIMLLFALPALFQWINSGSTILRGVGRTGSVLLLAALWNIFAAKPAQMVWIVTHWAVFVLLLAAFLATIPDWLWDVRGWARAGTAR